MTDEELLKKIDEIRERIPVSYQEARRVLKQSKGDLVEALARLEEDQAGWKEKFQNQKIMSSLEILWQKGLATKIRLKKNEETLLEVPAVAGAAAIVGMLASPGLAFVGALGTATALLKECSLEVKRLDSSS